MGEVNRADTKFNKAQLRFSGELKERFIDLYTKAESQNNSPEPYDISLIMRYLTGIIPPDNLISQKDIDIFRNHARRLLGYETDSKVEEIDPSEFRSAKSQQKKNVA